MISYAFALFIQTKEALIFSKLPRVPNWPDNHRLDLFGRHIIFEHYGNRNLSTAWEIDHIIPTAKGGTDDLSNLQALQWASNLFKSDNSLIQAVRKLAENQTTLHSNQSNNTSNTYNNYLYNLPYRQK